MNVIRRLGRNEAVFSKLNDDFCTWNIVVVSHLKGRLTKQVLHEAVHALQHKYPVLNYCIQEMDGNLVFASSRTSNIHIRVIEGHTESPWEGIVQQELNTKIVSDEYLFRFAIVYLSGHPDTTYLITTSHHAVSDGQSSFQLQSHILRYCQYIASDTAIPTEVSLSLISPVENFLPKYCNNLRGIYYRIAHLFQLSLRNIRYPPSTLHVETYLPMRSRRSEVIHRRLNPQLTQSLIDRSKKEATTVHCSLMAAMIVAYLNLTGLQANDCNFHCQSSVDLRSRFESTIPNDILGSFASLVRILLKPERKVAFWELSRMVKAEIDASLLSKDHFRLLLISRFLLRYLRLFSRQISTSIHISNVGRIEIPRIYGSFQLEETSFVTSNSFYAGVFTAEVTTFNSIMSINFSYEPNMLNPKMMQELIEHTIACIKTQCCQELSSINPHS